MAISILSRVGLPSLSVGQIFYTMQCTRFLAGCTESHKSFDLDRVELGILNAHLKTGVSFDRTPNNLFDRIDIGEGESFREPSGLAHVDGDPAAAAIGIDFDPTGVKVERGGRKRSVGRSSVDKAVFAQSGETDAEAMFVFVVRMVFFAGGMIEIGAAVVDADFIVQKQRLRCCGDHAAVPGPGVERNEWRVGKPAPVFTVRTADEKNFDLAPMRAVLEFVLDVKKPEQTEIAVAVVKTAETVEIRPIETALLRETVFVAAGNPSCRRLGPMNEVFALGITDASTDAVFAIALVGFDQGDVFFRAGVLEHRCHVAVPGLPIVFRGKL